MMLLADSEFVIALSRRPGSAIRTRADSFLERHATATLYISRVTTCEVSAGFTRRQDAAAVLHGFTPLEIDDDVAWQASRIARELKGKGQHIGDNDVWIAATAMAYGLPVVSNNARHLGRVKGLELRAY